MELWVYLTTALALSLDCFIVSLSNGVSLRVISSKRFFTYLVLFTMPQFLMPLIGWFLGVGLKPIVMSFDHWIAFVLLFFTGAKMIYDGLKEGGDVGGDWSKRSVVAQGLGTGIDAMVIGMSIAFLDQPIIWPSIIIGSVSLIATILGLRLGMFYSRKINFRVEVLAGIVVIGLGVKILLEHVLDHGFV